jgi:4-hydroxy-4-methyl-2-oxoglutarate aldolase
VVPPDGPLVGVAVTSHSRPGDHLGLFASLDLVREGDILVAACEGYREAALTGDLLMGMARNLGARGLVTDGAVRDLQGLRSVGLPVFASALTPNSPSRNGPGSAGLPVIIGGVRIASGDLVVADADGVVVIPRGVLAAARDGLARVRAAEAGVEAAVAEGLGVPDTVRAVIRDRAVEV